MLLHGFTGSAAEWADLTPHLAPQRHVIAVDLPGHGPVPAPADPAAYTMERCVADLLAVLDGFGLEQVDLLGYSMGGRVALHLAALAPQRVRSLILESASPGLADPAERAARAAADDALADTIVSQGIAWFADYWQSLPLFASQDALPAEARAALRERRMHSQPLGLAGSLRGMGTGRQQSLWHRLPQLTMPTLLITGELDIKFETINRQMAQLMPAARLTCLPIAGHTAHLERPQEFAELVVGFLRQQAS
ncbi:MAG: 2-succinyl-6-hydroxy-2,4-cyclohexadiene-1-carboxylate synthase [Oscillochloris sp.]|nr:2-succinyl-6-hydroxy-2,4-cyclohexadiene-1-carboxylate synthase [Oscillochloris sp.]